MLTSSAARAVVLPVFAAALFTASTRAQSTFVEPLPQSALQFTVEGQAPSAGYRIWTLENFGQAPDPTQAEIAEVVRKCKEVAAANPQTSSFPPSPAAFDLQFTVNSPPAGAAAAITAVESYYEALLTTTHASGPIMITVNFAPLGPSTIMNTASNAYAINWSTFLPAIVASADSDDILYSYLPTPTIPVQFTFGGAVTNSTDFIITAGTLVGTYPVAVGGVTPPHATITVNSSFAYDYDPTNGVTAGQLCFRTAFAHEIGHALGFNSAISIPGVVPTQLDLLRFQRSTNNATGFTDLKNHNRLVHSNTPNDDHESSLVFAHYPMEDGNPDQASHFRNQSPYVGLMTPSLATGETFHPNYLQTSDLRVLDFLGFDWNDPELQPLAQYRFDVEPNSTKAEASPATGMTAGNSIIGTTTGSGGTAGDTTLASVDYFRVKTAALPLGIYRHTLTLTTATAGVAGRIRGLNQVAGVIGTVDSPMQSSAAISGNQANVWYGFGKQEELYYAVNGSAVSTTTYAATLSTSTISVPTIAGSFFAGPITITTTTSTDTEIYVYDSNLNPVPLGHNDGPVPGGGAPAVLTVSLTPGTYYVAMSNFNTSNNQSDANPTEFYQTDPVLDFPNVIVNSSSATSGSLNYNVSDGTTTTGVTAAHSSQFYVDWAKFTVVLGAPRNDNCANAVSIPTGTTAGTLLGATHDGTASCDPGGAASKDVWYTHTNSSGGVRLLGVTTCGTSGVNDTVVSVYNACGGTQLACNDSCSSPCSAPSACVSGIPMSNGQTVWIRVSDKGLGISTGAFSLNLTETIPTPPNDSCATPIAISGYGTFPIDNTGATTGAEGQSEPLCNVFGGPAVRQDTWFTWTPTQTATVTLSTCGLIGGGPSEDSKIAVYQGAGCPTGAAIACNDDAIPTCAGGGASPQFHSTLTFTAVCGTTYTFQMGMYQAESLTMLGSFSVSGSGSACPTPTTSVCKGDGSNGPCPCGNTSIASGSGCANPFFGGAGATLSSTGIASIAADTLVLTATNIPGPGLFIQENPGSQVNFGDGLLCSTTAIVRMGVVFSSGGVATYPGGTTPAPIHIAGSTANGNVRVYQCWYRSTPSICNPGQLYNLTQGLQLTWGP